MVGKKYDDSVRKEYLNWLMTPPGQREPATKKELAVVLKVSERTLYNWEGSDEFQREMRTLKGKWGVRWYGDILGRLMAVVQDGQDGNAIRAAQVLLQHLEIAPEKADEVVTSEAVAAIAEALKDKGYKVVE